jgi:2-C-methyl-D-erythritol 4-phosphate cytidylyltransferase
MGARLPKQFLGLAGEPILVHTLRALARAACVAGLVVAVPPERVAATRRWLGRQRLRRRCEVVAGGAGRQESVWLGLQAAGDAEWVLVHDAVRPFITPELVARVLAAAGATGAATCGLPVRETVKRMGEDGTAEATLDRTGLWLVQTPQAFRRDLLWEAHDKARRDGFVGTDDAVLVERLGGRVALVPGLPQNLKITTREDLTLARRWMARSGR